MNLTMEEVEESNFVFDSYGQRVFVAVLFLIVFVLGITGNSLTILAVVVSRKLQSVTNVFVINLAVADLLTCLTVPWNIVAMLRQRDWPIKSGWSCTMAAGILLMCVGVSVYTLATIALNRYILITRTSLFRKIYKPSVIVVWVALLWFIPFCISIVPPILGIGALGYNPKYKTCSDISSEYLPHTNNTQTFDLIQAAGVFPIPLIVLFFCYINIILFVRKNAKNLVQWKPEKSKSMYGETTVTSDGVSQSTSDTMQKGNTQIQMGSPGDKTSKSDTLNVKKRSTITRREIEVTKNLFIVFCVFFVCLMPYAVCLFYEDSDPFIPYAAAILLFNSCLNPIIYATRFPNFKKVFKLILKCKWDKIPEPSGILLEIKRLT
ncbi:putative alpha-1A adrenergic receptor-like [Apostichopus japonicus]|uniref:Putative alpha-1A adrenergic receptor-like n=1 Tax=Stichopus japonicus TaxID=307972 RepID=A0A2G8L2X9_STIJA|nr:putative alpha-1A adrenergic receptor-like [Apostichopus japonicus]